MATKKENEQITEVLVAVGRLETHITGGNGGGLLKRAAVHGEQIDTLQAEVADLDKRVSMNAMKLAMMVTGGGTVSGGLVALINWLSNGGGS